MEIPIQQLARESPSPSACSRAPRNYLTDKWKCCALASFPVSFLAALKNKPTSPLPHAERCHGFYMVSAIADGRTSFPVLMYHTMRKARGDKRFLFLSLASTTPFAPGQLCWTLDAACSRPSWGWNGVPRRSLKLLLQKAMYAQAGLHNQELGSLAPVGFSTIPSCQHGILVPISAAPGTGWTPKVSLSPTLQLAQNCI